MNPERCEKVSDFQKLCGSDLLKTMPNETKLFDNISSSESQSSKLSGPFSDVVYSAEIESKKKAKELFGKDLYAAFSFSQEFMSTIKEIKTEIITDNQEYVKLKNLVAEDLEKIKCCMPSESEKSNPLRDNFLLFSRLNLEVEDTTEDVDEQRKNKEGKEKNKKTVTILEDDEETIFDIMSEYWRLLSVFDDFKISPPWYGAYSGEKTHWLQTNPIPSNVLENAREKCFNWLSKYFD